MPPTSIDGPAPASPEQLLAALPLFTGLAPDTLRTMAASLTPETAAAGTAVVSEGDPADDMYVVVEGEVKVVAVDGRRNRYLRTLGPGQAFGEYALLVDGPRTATVRAVTDVRLFRLPGAAVRALPDAVERVRRILDERSAADARDHEVALDAVARDLLL